MGTPKANIMHNIIQASPSSVVVEDIDALSCSTEAVTVKISNVSTRQAFKTTLSTLCTTLHSLGLPKLPIVFQFVVREKPIEKLRASFSSKGVAVTDAVVQNVANEIRSAHTCLRDVLDESPVNDIYDFVAEIYEEGSVSLGASAAAKAPEAAPGAAPAPAAPNSPPHQVGDDVQSDLSSLVSSLDGLSIPSNETDQYPGETQVGGNREEAAEGDHRQGENDTGTNQEASTAHVEQASWATAQYHVPAALEPLHHPSGEPARELTQNEAQDFADAGTIEGCESLGYSSKMTDDSK